ncbi:MAG: hypothetical protein ACAI18_03260 [Gemmatimonadales bacterium]
MTDQWEPVDLSPLDPARRPEWTARVESTRRAVAATVERRAQRQGPLDMLSGWARPVLAAAAVLLALLGGADALLRGSGSSAPVRLGEARRLALLSEASVAHSRAPSGAELRTILREPLR